VDLLAEGHNHAVAVLQYDHQRGFHVEGYDANRFRDRWGLIHARPNLAQPYHSINTDIQKRIRHLDGEGELARMID